MGAARAEIEALIERQLEAGTEADELVAVLLRTAATLTTAMVGGDEGMVARLGDAACEAMRSEAHRKVGVA